MLRFAVAGVAVLPLILAVIAALTVNWYTIEVTSSTAVTVKVNWGLFQSCTDGTCSTYEYKDFDENGCQHSAFDIEMRAKLIIGFVVGSAAFALLTICFSLCNTMAPCIIRMLCALLSLAGLVAAVAGYWRFTASWLYCEKDVCEHLLAVGATACSSSYSWSFFIALLGGIIALVPFVLSIVAIGQKDDGGGGGGTDGPVPDSSKPSEREPADSGAAHQGDESATGNNRHQQRPLDDDECLFLHEFLHAKQLHPGHCRVVRIADPKQDADNAAYDVWVAYHEAHAPVTEPFTASNLRREMVKLSYHPMDDEEAKKQGYEQLREPKQPHEEDPQQQSSRAIAIEDNNDEKNNSANNADNSAKEEPKPEPGEYEDDEWKYEAESGWYWSDKEELYWDPETNWYYNPYNCKWCDPDTNEWVDERKE